VPGIGVLVKLVQAPAGMMNGGDQRIDVWYRAEGSNLAGWGAQHRCPRKAGSGTCRDAFEHGLLVVPEGRRELELLKVQMSG
jgi:hypothetical protein